MTLEPPDIDAERVVARAGAGHRQQSAKGAASWRRRTIEGTLACPCGKLDATGMRSAGDARAVFRALDQDVKEHEEGAVGVLRGVNGDDAIRGRGIPFGLSGPRGFRSWAGAAVVELRADGVGVGQSSNEPSGIGRWGLPATW